MIKKFVVYIILHHDTQNFSTYVCVTFFQTDETMIDSMQNSDDDTISFEISLHICLVLSILHEAKSQN